MIGEEELESQYDEEDSWEEKGFMKGMEEADVDKKKRKTLFSDGMDDLEDEFDEKFSDEH